MEIVRFKAVSTCLGIRRKSISYFLYESNKVYDVSVFEHPLNSLKTISIINDSINILDITSKDDVIPFRLKAYSLDKEVEEICYLETKLMEINESNINLVSENKNEIFDEDQGEYEFICGFYYLNTGLKEVANDYFKASLDKGFKLANKYIG